MIIAGTELGTHQIFSITAALLVLPTVWLKNLSMLSYISGQFLEQNHVIYIVVKRHFSSLKFQNVAILAPY